DYEQAELALVGRVDQLHLEAVAVPLLSQRAGRDVGLEFHKRLAKGVGAASRAAPAAPQAPLGSRGLPAGRGEVVVPAGRQPDRMASGIEQLPMMTIAAITGPTRWTKRS